MKIFDSKSSKKISFNPLKKGKVSLYVCGMTVYDSCHIGHLRTFLSFDFIVKSFRALDYDVHYVRNITDVDDKIIAKAKSEKTSPSVISEKYIQEMHDDFSSMSMLSPDVEPKVTEHMDSIISFIDNLLSKNFAYTTEHGDVFFNVDSFNDYGELSNRRLEDMVSGSRIEIDDTKDSERIHVYHKSGTFVEMQPNGDVVTQHKNGFRTVTGNDKLHVTKDLDIIVDGNINLSSRKNINITALGNIDARATRIDLNNSAPSLPDARFVDDPVKFEPNIVSVLPEETIEEVQNSEQVEGEKPQDVDYEELAPAVCGEVDHVNPYDIAQAHMDAGGWAETGSNPKIKSLWDEIGYNGSQYADETAWCATFVGAILKRSGNKYIKTASSQAYAKYGKTVTLDDVQQGDIVVFFRKSRSSGLGHVGFATGNSTATTIEVLGGNQSNNLNIKSFDKKRGTKWGLRTIRRAISCSDGKTEAPVASSAIGASSGVGSAVT